MVKLDRTSASSMMTSGAPLPASMAWENFVYSSAPWPALVQQIWTSSWVSLNRSTTCSKAGYQAHAVTCSASVFGMSLVQIASLPPALSSPLPSQAASTIAAAVRPAAVTTPRRAVRGPRADIEILLDSGSTSMTTSM